MTPAEVEALIAALANENSEMRRTFGSHPLFAELESRAEKAEAELAAMQEQLPEGMKHCTIRFRECEKGHGWLTATNWVQHGCPTCALAAQAQRIAELEWERSEAQRIAQSAVKRAIKAEAALRQAVPREPTIKMVDAGVVAYLNVPVGHRITEAVWRAMYDAAPAAPREKP